MRIIHDAIDEVLRDLPEQFLSELIAQKIASQGVKLSAQERQQVAEGVREGRDKFHLKRWSWWKPQRVTLDLTAEDIEQIERKSTEFIEDYLPELITRAISHGSQRVLADLKRNWHGESRLQHRELTGFKKRLSARWRMPLASLRMLLTISRELGDTVNCETREASDVSSQSYLIDVLIRLHARACQITEEIICLLEGGFADGAMARWRTLHEVAVVAQFISAHGEDLAERYVLHQAVESKRAMDDYQKCQPHLSYEPLEQGEIKAVRDSYDAVIARFGKNFKSQYGWAADHLNIARPTFENIEYAAGIGHLRAHYRMASHNVHANPKGLFFKLGLLKESELLLADPSNAGLADPGSAAALSLAQVSTALSLLQTTVDNTVALQIIAQLVDEIGEAFGKAHERLAEDAAKR
jgi:hypothetical protein